MAWRTLAFLLDNDPRNISPFVHDLVRDETFSIICFPFELYSWKYPDFWLEGFQCTGKTCSDLIRRRVERFYVELLGVDYILISRDC